MTFSVVTPSFNQAPFLPETLASVRTAADRASGHAVEHLVIDAGSTDGTLDVLRAQQEADWISESDRGQADAVNKGWARASGEIFSFLCADDLWVEETVRRVGDAFAADPKVDVVYGDYYFLEGGSGWRRRKTAGPWSTERLRRENFLSQPATFIRRRIYERFGGLDDSLRFCLDHEYWLRISGETTWHYIPEPLAVMRLHGDSKTSSQLTAAWWETARMCRRYGVGARPWLKALRMQLGGWQYYLLKRRIFEWLGNRRRLLE